MRWQVWLRRPSFVIALAVVVVVGLVWGVAIARSAQPETLDQRVHDVASQLQCPVCNGESVADAPSPIAQEMRSVIREKLAAGDSEQQVLEYFRQRYGDSIMETPPWYGFTSLIWLAPVLMLLGGAVMLGSLARSWHADRATTPSMALDADEDSASRMSEEERQRYLAQLRRELAADEGFLAQPGTEGV